MIDFLHLPKPQNGYVDYFPGFSNTAGGSWEVWNKPRGINFIKIITIGGGGGGSAGALGGSGGGGGGSGGVTTVMLPAIFLPDRLYVSSGCSGPGSKVNNIGGTAGVASYISIAPSAAAIYVACYANGGGGGTFNTGPGAAGSVATIANTLQAGMGNFTALAGQSGGGGAFGNGVGSSVTYPTTGILLSGGAGGGGSSGSGGDIIAPASQTSTYTIVPTLSGGTPGNRGVDGINNMELLLFSGGSGGGGSGNGGNGGIGCGGGGGGAGTPIGGGGDGGPGLVIISCW